MATSSWIAERPRQLAVPAPYSSGASKQPKTPDTIRALREKLSDFHAENQLLGNLVKDLKAERDGLSKKLAATTKQLGEANSKAAAASLQADAATREQKRFQAEVDRLSAVVHSHSIRLQKSKQHQQELEDVALELRSELDEAKAKLEAADAAAQQAQQRCTAAEAKLVAAGLGSLPKMGPTAEQLVINSTQRIKELTEELTAVKTDSQQQLASLQQQVQQAQAAAQQAQQTAQQQVQQQEMLLQQQAGRLQASNQQCKQLQESMLDMQQKVVEGQVFAQAQKELQQLKQDMLTKSQSLQQQVCNLQGQLADTELKHAAAVSDTQQQLTSLQQQLAAAQREKQELTATLIAVRQQETGSRVLSGETAAKAERLRGELVRCVGELQSQLQDAAAAGEQHKQVLQQLRAVESTAAAAREEASEMRQQLVELATVTVAELREQVAGEAVAITGLPAGLDQSQLPLPVSSYIKVLEHAVCDCEQRCKQLLADTLSAQQQERELRQQLATAREQQAATQRALQQQTQRLLAAEKMRLSDLREVQGLEKRLLLSQQECWNLRDALIKAKSGEAGAALITSTAAAAVPLNTATAGSPTAASIAAILAAPQGQQQQQQQLAAVRRPPGGLSWANGAADAAATHPSAAAAAAAGAAGQYQSKLEQLRQLKSQLNCISRGKAIRSSAAAAAAAAAATATGLAAEDRATNAGDAAANTAFGDQQNAALMGRSSTSNGSGATTQQNGKPASSIQGSAVAATGLDPVAEAVDASAVAPGSVRASRAGSLSNGSSSGRAQQQHSSRSGSINGHSKAKSAAAAAPAAAPAASEPYEKFVRQQPALGSATGVTLNGDTYFGLASAVEPHRHQQQYDQQRQQSGPSLKHASSTLLGVDSAAARTFGSAAVGASALDQTRSSHQADEMLSPKELLQECSAASLGSMGVHILAAKAGKPPSAATAAAASSSSAEADVSEPSWQQQLKQWEQQRHRWQQLEANGAFGLDDLSSAGEAAASGLQGGIGNEAWDSGVWRP